MIQNKYIKDTNKKIKLPFIIWIVSISTIVACIGGRNILGYQVSGLGWFIPLVTSFFVLMRQPGRIKLPVAIWIPWVCLILIYLILAEDPNAFQRSIMMLCPLIIGMTVSKYSFTEQQLKDFIKLFKYMAITLCIIVVLKTGLLITGTLPMITGLAAETMTATLFCSLFAARYMFGEKRALTWWAAVAAIPVIALTRMGILATGMSLALTFAPMKIFKRIILIILLCVIGYNIFYTERMQQKMFYSGRGTFEDIQRDNPNFASTGRFRLWEMMEYQIDKKPWFGHGANASETFVSAVTGGLKHPHNDWLRLRYDYGYIGTVIFGFCLLLQLLHALKRGRMCNEEIRIIFYAGATSILVFALFMFTDNIILYAAFFGNLQFTILGLAYASLEKEKSVQRPAIRLRW